MKITSTTLPKNIFQAKIAQPLMAQAVKVYLSNKRQNQAKVKSRGEITGSTRKIYRQKGTGRARHGAKSAPIFVGGGVTHGPKGQKNYKRKLTRTMRNLALVSALSQKAQSKQILVVDTFQKLAPKTKAVNKALISLFPKTKKQKKSKITLIISKTQDNLKRGTSNIPFVKFVNAKQLTTYQVLVGGTLIFTKDSLKTLKQRLS